MDPAPARVSTEKLESWLRYYEDLGIRSFFRDRAAAPVEAAVVEAAATVEETTLKPGKKQTPPDVRVTVAAAALPAREGVAHAPSLFESVERVIGDTLERVCSDLGECTRCKLHRHRNKIVFGAGNPRAELMFVGEGPGHDEDLQGLPFVGRAGQLLTQMIEAMGLSRSDVYIANVVKCRPPNNRNPQPEEALACEPYLHRQIDLIQPKLIVALGKVAAVNLLAREASVASLRNKIHQYRGIPLIVTYHPAYLLRSLHEKARAWEDLCFALDTMKALKSARVETI